MKLISVLVVLLLLVSCKEKQTKVELSVNPTFNGESIQFNKNYTIFSGLPVTFNRLSFYMTDINIATDIEGQENIVLESAKYDYDNGNLLGNIDFKTKSDGKIIAFSSSIGVNATLNHEDPTQYNSDNPLSYQNSNGMHWNWNSGYIFVIIEGQCDTVVNSANALPLNFAYHVGMDSNLTGISFSSLEKAILKGETNNLVFNLDLAQLFQSPSFEIDLKTERFTHSNPSQEALTTKVRHNFNKAISIH